MQLPSIHVNKMNSPNSQIKDVYIELDDYKFFHTPFDSKKNMGQRFVGREKIKQRIITLLDNSVSSSGTYLITGFRGMGKTSVVRESISKLNNDNKQDNRDHINRKTIVYLRILLFIIYSFCILWGIGISKLLPSNFHTISLMSLGITLVISGIILESKSNTFFLWRFLQAAMFSSSLFILLLYLNFPKEFCSDSDYGFNCIESKISHLFYKISDKSFYITSAIGVVMFYILLSTVIFIYDSTVDFIPLLKKTFQLKIQNSSSISKSNISKDQSQSTEPWNNFIVDRFTKFDINLSQDTISDREVLKRICDKIKEFWIDNESSLNKHGFQRSIYKPWITIINFISKKRKRPESKYHEIYGRLDNLQKRLAGSVSLSEELGSDPNLATTFVKGATELTLPVGKVSDRNTISYSIATAKEAEDELIKILQLIRDHQGEIDWGTTFVFVVDELDKIEPQSNALIDEKEFSNPVMDSPINVPGSREYRKRQEAVAKLLANLKGFLSLSEAKFIFIGGRELFDADLADIADRDSFYSSIFNDVIYVDSFYRDVAHLKKKSGITGVTELYLLNLIRNGCYDKEYEIFRLADLHNFVQKTGDQYYVSKEKSIPTEWSENKFKIFSVLQNFIIYLTYRGTGAPKKLTSLVESLIVMKSRKELYSTSLCLFNSDDTSCETKRLFIRFSYNTQYEINLTTDIFRPYLITNSRFLTKLGDKLLFSTPFIFDHIIKFYPYGFSWRNLELIPEVVLVNKEPYLREHIQNILQYLKKYQIKQSIGGLYEYKFHSIIQKELSILTKSSDLAAAAFNFTLDESLLVKRHYKKKLIELRNKYNNYSPLPGDNQFIHSLSFVQTILGDLYFYDKEFDEAILYYTESIQALRLPNAIDDQYITRHQFFLWLRNTLKIGLTLEKIEAFDSAISLYRTLTIDTYRYLQNITGSDTDYYNEEHTKKLSLSHTKKITYLNKHDELANRKSEDHRNMHLVTLPFIAQLATIEKMRVDGLTYSNLYQNKKDLYDMIQVEYLSELPLAENLYQDEYRRRWLWSDYFSNVGSILFLKNKQFTEFFKSLSPKTENISHLILLKSPLSNKPDNFRSYYLHLTEGLKKQLEKRKNILSGPSDYSPSLISCFYYIESLYSLVSYHNPTVHTTLWDKNLLKEDINLDPIQMACALLHSENAHLISSRRLYYLGNIVNKLGDAVLSSLMKNDRNAPSKKEIVTFRKLVNVLGDDNSDLKTFMKDVVNNLNIISDIYSLKNVILIYYLSAMIFKKSGESYYHSFSLKKILLLLKEVTSINSWKKKHKNIIISFSKHITTSIIQLTADYSSFSNRAQIKKHRSTLNLSGTPNNPKINTTIYNSTANNHDAYEALLIVESIRMRLDAPYESVGLLAKNTEITRPKYIRLLQLKLHLERQYQIVDQMFNSTGFFNELSDRNNRKPYVPKEQTIILRKALVESLFSLRESIKIIQLYSPGYIIGYTHLAVAHHRAGQWCSIYERYFRYKNYPVNKKVRKEPNTVFNESLEKLIGQSSMHFLESRYQFEMASKNYELAIEMHSEGPAYKNKVSSLYILEDDYNDSLTHFNISLERYLINTEDIRSRINKLKIIIKNSNMYNYENYSGQE